MNNSKTQSRQGLHFDHQNWFLIAIIILTVVAVLAIQIPRFLNHDVAFLSWTAQEVMGPKIFGNDILEPNPPLAFLIYWPAAVLGEIIPLDLAVKIWVSAIAGFSLIAVGKGSPASLRIPLMLALGIFFVVAFPREFGQREQIALLLCAPYLIGYQNSKTWSIINGAMAAIGFAVKPHFLIPLALVFLFRRKIRTEEKIIVIVGAAYALSIPLFFPDYLYDFLPAIIDSYWGIGASSDSSIARITVILALLIPGLLLVLMSDQSASKSLGVAALGFFIAALVQGKWFPYHFLPAWGFLTLAVTCCLVTHNRILRFAAIALLSGISVPMTIWASVWWTDAAGREQQISGLLEQIDLSNSFVVIAVHPYPSFPTTIQTDSKYLGLSNSHWFLPGAAKIDSGEAKGRPKRVIQLAIDQAVSELRAKPELVIIDTDWKRHTGLKSATFDGLQWLRMDASFEQEWRNYESAGSVDRFKIFRRVM